MTGFLTVQNFFAPFKTIRTSLATIRSSPWGTDRERAGEELQKARKEVVAFLKGLEPGTLVRVVPYLNGEVKGLRFLNGQLVHCSVDEAGETVSLTVNSEGRVALWRVDLRMEKILQIEKICKQKE